MNTFAKQSLQTCNATHKACSKDDVQLHLKSLDNWQAQIENSTAQIIKIYNVKNYAQAMTFANEIANLAEQENHHPKVCIEWAKLTISWWTHTVNGLFINDFIMAARCDDIFAEMNF